MTTMYAIKKDNKYVKDYTEGKKLTVNLTMAEIYYTRKAAVVAAQSYGKLNGKGYSVVEI